MSTPVLSKKQLRHSLSAKKTPVKGLRNVLAHPHENYWPIVDTKSGVLLQEVLAQSIKVIRRPNTQLPWSRLRQFKREERAEEKKQELSQQEILPDKALMSSVITGINAVTRALEKKSVCCVLLDSNVDPPLLIKHVVMMAQNKQIPILLVPFLKSMTATNLGYPSASLALKTLVAECTNHHFHLLYTTILNGVENAAQTRKAVHIFEENERYKAPLKKEITKAKETVPESRVTQSSKACLSTNVYKYRSPCGKRAFPPPDTGEEVAVTTTEATEYISINQYDSPSSADEDFGVPIKRLRITKNPAKKLDVPYSSLKVIKQQGNLNRAKATKTSTKKKK